MRLEQPGPDEPHASLRLDRKLALPMSVAMLVAILLMWGVLVAPRSPLRSLSAVGLIVCACLIYTFAVWYAVQTAVRTCVPVWKCAILAMLLGLMQIAAACVVASGSGLGRHDGCTPHLAAVLAGWLVYGMVLRSVFPLTLSRALGVTLVASILSLLGSLALVFVATWLLG